MGRTPCCDKNGLKKGPWTPEEDQKLLDYIQNNGYGNWRTLPKNAGLQRCGKSCRLRWTNYLRPDIKRGRFSFEEEETIIQLHSVLGNKWSSIAARLPGRTDNEIKNYWNTHIKKKLLRMGIDPVTHSPRLDLLDLSSLLTTSSLTNPSSSSSSQINNISRLLGIQLPLINPELLTLATSLFSSHRQNPNFFQQNVQDDQYHRQLMINAPALLQNQLPPLIQPTSTHPIDQGVPFLNNDDDQQAQLMEPTSEFNSQSCDQLNISSTDHHHHHHQLQNNDQMNSNLLMEGYVPMQDYYCYNYASEPSIISDPGTNFQSNDSSNDFSFGSILSNLSSTGSTPLNSSSAYINGGSSTEDEKEISYCSSNMLKFEIPADINLDVNDQLM